MNDELVVYGTWSGCACRQLIPTSYHDLNIEFNSRVLKPLSKGP